MAKLRFFGVAAYEIVNSKGQHILIDPFIDSCPVNPIKSSSLERVDLICVTHGAPDHYGDTFAIAARTSAPVVCSADVKQHLIASGLPAKQITATCWNIRVEINGIKVHPLECHHWSHMNLPDGSFITGTPLAFLIHVDKGIRFYHYGDTALFSDLKIQGELYRPTHGAIGVTQPTEILNMFEGPDKVLTGEMNPYEAFLASHWLRLKVVFPCHYINPDNEDANQFNRYILESQNRGKLYPKSIVLKPGEWTEMEPIPEDETEEVMVK